MATAATVSELSAQIAQVQSHVAAMQNNMNQMHSDMLAMEENHNEALNTVWMLVAGALVFFMHVGFSMLEAGCVRFKNTQNILGKNMLVIAIGFLCWWFIGWALAYGKAEQPNKLLGSTQFLAHGFLDDKSLFRQFFFQGAFCATSGTIVSGSMAERTRLEGFMLYTTFMTAFIYPVGVYWGWSGNGFLNYEDSDGTPVAISGPAYMDFAGSGLVHLVGGVSALLGAYLVGPRKGRFDPTVSQLPFTAHNVQFIVFGTLILWFGWFGFNPGSTLSMSDKNAAYTAGIVAVNTTLAPCVSGLVVFFMKAFVMQPKLLDIGAFCNGILSGLVSITAGCSSVQMWEAAMIGFIGGFVYLGSSQLVEHLRIDDVVDAASVHGGCGLWGVLALGVFGNPKDGLGGNGLLYGGDQLATQITAVVVLVPWTSALSFLAFSGLRYFDLLRLSDEAQDKGADAKATPARPQVMVVPLTPVVPPAAVMTPK